MRSFADRSLLPPPRWAALTALAWVGLSCLGGGGAHAHDVTLAPAYEVVDPFDNNIIRTARLFNRATLGFEIERLGGNITTLQLRAQGDVAFFDGRLGAGLDIPFLRYSSGVFAGTLGGQELSSTDFGDLRLRVGGQVYRYRGPVQALLTVGLRVTFPTGTQTIEGIAQSRRYLIEPAALLAVTWRRLTFTTNQGVATAPAGGVGSTVTSYASSYALSLYILRWLGASAGVDVAVPIALEGASTTAYVTPAVSFFLPWRIHAAVGVRVGVAGAPAGSPPDVTTFIRAGLEWDSFGARKKPASPTATPPPPPAPAVSPPPSAPPTPPVTPPVAPPVTPPAPVPGEPPPSGEVPGQPPAPPGGAEPPPVTPPPLDEPDRPAPPPPPPPPPL